MKSFTNLRIDVSVKISFSCAASMRVLAADAARYADVKVRGTLGTGCWDGRAERLGS